MIDLGGGSGELLAGVLAQHPAARGLLFDLAPALAHAPAVLRRLGVDKRCELQPGNSFDRVLPSDTVYLLKSVLHDWDDEPAVHLLRRCAAEQRPGAQLVVLERLLPEHLSAAAEHRTVVRSDLNIAGGAGRTRATTGGLPRAVRASRAGPRYGPFAGCRVLGDGGDSPSELR